MVLLLHSLKRRSVWLVVGSVLIVAGATAAATVATTHQSQQLPATPPGNPSINNLCAEHYLTGSIIDNLTSVAAGSAGSVLYVCNETGLPDTWVFQSLGVTATPTFTLPNGLVALAYTPDHPTPRVNDNCYSSTTNNLTSGTPVVIPVGQYDFCGFYKSYPDAGIASFTVNWASP
jgi:hypothetical protein